MERLGWESVEEEDVLPEPVESAAPPSGPTRFRTFDPSRGQLPESLTLDAYGNVFLSMSSYIAKVAPSGLHVTHASLPLPSDALALGVKIGHDGALYCATGSFREDPEAAGVYRVFGPDRVERFAALDPRGFPNDLAFDPAGRLYVTDPFLGRIYRIDRRGESRVWLEHDCLRGDPKAQALAVHDFGVDGICFDVGHRTLFVGNLDRGMVVRIPVRDDGSAGEPTLHARSPLLKGADGLALDILGRMVVAVNAQDRLARVELDGSVRVLAEGSPLDAPSSVAFGTRRGDEQTLYIASFAVNRALGAVPGLPRPGLLTLHTDARGLPLR